MNIVLHQPEIAGNTGNIGRTCMASGTKLHLIEPLGFQLTQRELRRSGMDYWEELDVQRYMNYEEFLRLNPGARIWYATTKAERTYADVSYEEDDFIMYGKECAGIPEEILAEHRDRCIRIPMDPEARSLNLANSAAIILYEALRQKGFPGLLKKGKLHRLSYKD